MKARSRKWLRAIDFIAYLLSLISHPQVHRERLGRERANLPDHLLDLVRRLAVGAEGAEPPKLETGISSSPSN